MAKGMREIKSQIKSVQNIKQITKAMEMVAASRLRRAQASAEAARPYADKIKEVVASIANSKGTSHPMLQMREVRKSGYLVITSDRGLTGGYNSNVLRLVMHTIQSKHKSKDEYEIFVIGRKGREYFKKRDMPVTDEVTGLPHSPKFADIKEITTVAIKQYETGAIDELVIFYNEFVNALSQVPVHKQLLPLADDHLSDHANSYEYEPSAEGVLDVLLPKFAEAVIYSALLEGKASEFGAQMTSMGNATKNATTVISDLTLVYNRARQAAITQEISEIVAGANAQM